MPSRVEHVDGVVSLEGKQGVVLASNEAGLSFVAPGKDSYLVLDTKNLAILKAGDNSVAIYDNNITGGMIDIQADAKGAVNLAVQDGTTQNTALTVTDGNAHLGVFNVAKFDRLHVEAGKIALESSVGPVGASTKLGTVEVTPTKVTIKCLESTMEVDVNGFSWENAAKSFQTSKFCVQDKMGTNKFEIDLLNQTITLTGLKLDLQSTIEASIRTLENKLTTGIASIEQKGIQIKNDAEALIQDQSTLINANTDAISKLASRVTTLENCWVARAVFGQEDYRWQLFRHWLFGQDFHPDRATWLQAAYLRHGPWFAEVVRRHSWLRKLLLPVMARCIRGLKGVPHQAFGRAALSRPVSLISQAF
jgi:hypothetical protein